MNKWAWQDPDWPQYSFDEEALTKAENAFVEQLGEQAGMLFYVEEGSAPGLRVKWLAEEAMKTSEIEGEMLNRQEVQSSLMRRFGMGDPPGRNRRAEGIADLMMAMYQEFKNPLTHEILWQWHQDLFSSDQWAASVGHYRPKEMDIVSGPLGRQKVHYTAPPPEQVHEEMDRFISWFNQATLGKNPFKAICVAGIAHLWFEQIHPFSDGNGRIGRAIAEKALARSIGRPSLIPLSGQISRDRKGYENAFQTTNRSLDVTRWLAWFSETALKAQTYGAESLVRVVKITEMLQQHKNDLNERQNKVLLRLIRAEPEGFEGGLSAKNYVSITQAAGTTATRDLSELAAMGLLRRTGERRHTRYWLNVPEQEATLPVEKSGEAPEPNP